MSIKDEINSAIAAHGQWKHKLKKAIDTGECESTPEKVKKDNNCSFGKWLHERIDPQYKSSPYYNEVLKMHADFHSEAGEILRLALNGKPEDANKKIGLGSPFNSISAELTRKMGEWRDTL